VQLVSPVELTIAIGFLALAGRSAVYWMRHRIEAQDTTDEVLFALFVTGRVGTWLMAAGLFLLFGSIELRGRAYRDEASGYSWLFIVFLLLGALQLIAGWFLGAREQASDSTTSEAGDEPRPPVERT
jgi:cytochrome bd-type quinol oxidase subunit 1